MGARDAYIKLTHDFPKKHPILYILVVLVLPLFVVYVTIVLIVFIIMRLKGETVEYVLVKKNK